MVRGRSLTSAAGAIAALLVLAAAACSLGLDESLIDKAKDGGFGATPDDADAVDDGGAGDTGTIPGTPDAAPCTSDEACTTTDGCLKGKCDRTRKTCVYDLCRPSACNAGTCSEPAHTCGPPVAYKLRASTFELGAQVACTRCAAAVHPWLYVVTGGGLVAFNVANPTSTKPPQVPIVGLGFVPNAIVSSGSRVWLVGEETGPGPSRVQLAYIDSPADPFAKKIEAQTVLATSSRAPGGLLVFGRGGDSALLVSPAAPHEAVAVEAPLVEPVNLAPKAVSAPNNFVPRAVSGKRLLFAASPAQPPAFTLVDNAGVVATPDAGDAAVVVGYGAGNTFSNQRVYAQSSDGVVFVAASTLEDAPPNGTVTRGVRGWFVVAGESAPISAPPAGVDIETYSVDNVAANAPVFGASQASAALIDGDTAMIAVQSRDDAARMVVQFVKRSPLGLVQQDGGARRSLLDVAPNTIVAATGSNGIGYVLANDKPANATVFVLDPACAP